MPKLELSLLGRFQIALNGQPITAHLTAKTQALLVFLASEGHEPHRRDALAGLLWPAEPNEAARNSLRQALHQLSHALGDADPSFLLTTPQTVQFNPACDYAVDVTEFTTVLQACETHRHRQRETCRACVARVQRAAALYHGDFLAEFFLKDSTAFEEWALVKREQLARSALSGLQHLAEYYARCGEFEGMEQAARRQIAIDPYHEEAHRQLMRALAGSGQRTAALAHFEAMCQMLIAELGAKPDRQTIALHTQIQSDTLAPYTPPPLRNWPFNPTSFVGRDTELAQIADYLQDPAVSLLTLVGPGGIGKTRLALQAAEREVQAFRNGACFVPLAEVAGAEFFVLAIVRALHIPFMESPHPKLHLINYLRDTRQDLLLVLDSMEQVVQGSELISEILHACPSVKILATSRESLNLQEEWRMPIGGLDLPDRRSLADLEACGAAQLFLQRARQARSDFVLSSADRAAITHICELLAGMPLGLELAAAWVQKLSCPGIAREIERSLNFLTTPLRNVPERHRSLRAAFDYSWNLLTDEERQAFRQVAVFRGGFRREAVEAVINGQWPTVGNQLIDKSLLQVTTSGRYEQHPLAHQYADEKLAELPEERDGAQERHGRYYADFLWQRRERLTVGQQQAQAEIGEEIENVRTAWRWAVTGRHLPEIRQCLEGLASFYLVSGWYAEGEAAMGQAVAVLDHEESAASDSFTAMALGGTLVAQGMFSVYLGRIEPAKIQLERSLGLLRSANVPWLVALALMWLGEAETFSGEYRSARMHLEEGLTLAQATGKRWLIAGLYYFLGHVARTEDYAEAAEHYQASVTIYQEIGDRRAMTGAIFFLAEVTRLSGNLAEARRYADQSLMLAQETDARNLMPWSLLALGHVAHDLKNYEEARQRFQASLELARQIGINAVSVWAQEGLGAVALALGRAAEARRHFYAALQQAVEMRAVQQVIGLLIHWADLSAGQGQAEQERAVEWLAHVLHHPACAYENRVQTKRLIDQLRPTVPPDVFAATWERGQSRPIEEIVSEILRNEMTAGER
jgi:predicted ATPase/DNA-binding SARP family transcriptional activator